MCCQYSVYFDDEDDKKNKATIHIADNCRVLLSTHVTLLDTLNKKITLSTGEIVTYDTCCLATGASPRTLPSISQPGLTSPSSGRILTYRTLDDFVTVHNEAKKAKSIAIVGGGYLGVELAYALAKTPLLHETTDKVTGDKTADKATGGDRKLTIKLYTASDVLSKILPPYLSNKICDILHTAGVDVVKNTRIDVCTMSYHIMYIMSRR